MTGGLVDGDEYPKVIRIWRDETNALWDEHPGSLMSRVDCPNGQDRLVPVDQVTRHHTLREVWPAEQAPLFDVTPPTTYEPRWSE